MVHNERGEHDQALPHTREALQIVLEVFGDNHPFTAIAYHRMYLANKSVGESQAADECKDKLREILSVVEDKMKRGIMFALDQALTLCM